MFQRTVFPERAIFLFILEILLVLQPPGIEVSSRLALVDCLQSSPLAYIALYSIPNRIYFTIASLATAAAKASLPPLLFLSGSDFASCFKASPALSFTNTLKPLVSSNFWHICFYLSVSFPDVGSKIRGAETWSWPSGRSVPYPTPVDWPTSLIFHLTHVLPLPYC